MSVETGAPRPEVDLGPLREVVETLAALERRPGSPAERQAAHWVSERLARAGARVRVENAEFRDGYARLLLPLALAGLVSGGLALARGSRRVAATVPGLAAACLIDDISNGKRLWRRLFGRRKQTCNVVAELGDPDGPVTLVVMAHHDAAPTGWVFDQRLQIRIAERFPALVDRGDTSLPLWWPVVGAPSLVAVGVLTGQRKLLAAGTALSAAVCALALNVARSPTVPGANDNLSGVSALVGVAERMRDGLPPGTRLLLVSCGAEEVIQGGIYAFAAHHFRRLDPTRTWFLNLDTIGSPELVLVEGEGPFRMEDYCDPEFRDLIARAAARLGSPLRRGIRPRVSTDAVLPSRAGYPTATFASWDPVTKLPSNYHLMSDTPENLCYETVARVVAVIGAVIGELSSASAS